MQKTIELLKKHNLLKVIDKKLDIYLEIPHIAYIETKLQDKKAILFTNPIDKKSGKEFDTPVLMNLFANHKCLELFIGNIELISKEIEELLHMKQPDGLMDKINMFSKLFSLKNVFPNRINKKAESQTIIKLGDDVNLYDLPILTTWEQDGGAFITMAQVYTTSLDESKKNLGMYRLQIYDKNHLGLHWQIHKDSNHFFHEYKNAGKQMPVSIAIGGDPLYTWCATAPLPIGVFELFLYGFIKNKKAKIIKSITNDIYVPHDADFVIEGFVDTSITKTEGPFGDHTGYYTLEEQYPVLSVNAITQKQNPIYLATVVGKPPLEDKYMGHATERIFLPLLQTTVPDLVDYVMPENGVFHNLIIAKISPKYPSHAKQIMHALWGVGQMSFVKHAFFVDTDAPDLTDYDKLSSYILNRFSIDRILISYGVCDALDHSSPKHSEGGKLGVDTTEANSDIPKINLLKDDELLQKMQQLSSNITALKQYKIDTKNPIVVIKIDKKESGKQIFDTLSSLSKHINILVSVDDNKNDINNAYMLLWRVVNNIDSNRDIYIYDDMVAIDGTNKNSLDGFTRRWPDDVDCTKSVIDRLREDNIIDIDDEFINKFYIY
jgi:4-hydroxy-3-polyprenylbenzoate decarboxylase